MSLLLHSNRASKRARGLGAEIVQFVHLHQEKDASLDHRDIQAALRIAANRLRDPTRKGPMIMTAMMIVAGAVCGGMLLQPSGPLGDLAPVLGALVGALAVLLMFTISRPWRDTGGG